MSKMIVVLCVVGILVLIPDASGNLFDKFKAKFKPKSNIMVEVAESPKPDIHVIPGTFRKYKDWLNQGASSDQQAHVRYALEVGSVDADCILEWPSEPQEVKNQAPRTFDCFIQVRNSKLEEMYEAKKTIERADRDVAYQSSKLQKRKKFNSHNDFSESYYEKMYEEAVAERDRLKTEASQALNVPSYETLENDVKECIGEKWIEIERSMIEDGITELRSVSECIKKNIGLEVPADEAASEWDSEEVAYVNVPNRNGQYRT